MCRICCMFSLLPSLSGYFFPRFPSNVPSSRPGFPRAYGWCSIKTKLRAKHISQKRKVEEEQVRLLLWEGVWQTPGRMIPPWKVCRTNLSGLRHHISGTLPITPGDRFEDNFFLQVYLPQIIVIISLRKDIIVWLHVVPGVLSREWNKASQDLTLDDESGPIQRLRLQIDSVFISGHHLTHTKYIYRQGASPRRTKIQRCRSVGGLTRQHGKIIALHLNLVSGAENKQET